MGYNNRETFRTYMYKSAEKLHDEEIEKIINKDNKDNEEEDYNEMLIKSR